MKTKNFKIIDNFLDLNLFESIKNTILSYEFPWYYSPTVTVIDEDSPFFYFTHMFYINNTPNSNYFNLLYPLLDKLNPRSLIRIKGNCYPNLFREVKNDNHIDYNFRHKGAIYYLNSNNGKTILNDDIEVESLENRLLLFEPHVKHCSTHCTDTKIRVNINFNFF